MVNSNLSISRRCNELLLEHFTQLGRNILNNAQYNRRETLEINPMPSDIVYNILEQSMCQAISLPGISEEPDDLQADYRMEKKDRLIVKGERKKFSKI